MEVIQTNSLMRMGKNLKNIICCTTESFAIHLKLTQNSKLTTFQFKKIFKERTAAHFSIG